ncbi:flagellar protein FlgJ [Kushneria sinocarnis]|uniref:Peptidoglycan hydrolase FlgJ n=1 Tax=Kushneria sinocarnis TaxID=595502 RepID=A0A420WY27_9GAMM|nr:flagellar assembly peptidoglycan hydrolase FlgJ [Kushneria sinocarnis]RKR06088.1 flagellar protein FlgJ [Kushneria sinocarnis]
MALDSGSPRFALDVQGLSKLRYNARQAPDQGLKEVSQQFESVLLTMMLKSMRAASPKSELLDNSSMDTYKSMMDRQWAQTLSQRGIGLADMLVSQLGGQKAGKPDAVEGAAPGERTGLPAPEAPRTLSRAMSVGEEQVAALNAGRLEALRAIDEQSNRPVVAGAGSEPERASGSLFNQSNTGAGVNRAGGSAVALEDLPAHVSAFIAKVGDAARDVSRATGLSSRLIMAQAALETGWGRSEIRDGESASHNLFNIKATGGWQGRSTSVATTEYEHGRAVNVRDDFRVYDSYDQAFADYARLITDNPRYAGVVQAGSPEEAARQLQQGGYATDPNYASKLIAIMSQIPDQLGEMADRMGDRLFGDGGRSAGWLADNARGATDTPADRDEWSLARQPTRLF